MTISIITPSFGQLDWLRLCVASVADQATPEAERWKMGDGSFGGDVPKAQGGESRAAFETQSSAQSPLAIEHIIQDGGTPGIEGFAREVGAEFYRDGKLVFGSRPSIDGTLLPQSRVALPGSLRSSTAPAPAGLVLDPRLYRLAIFSEADAGMYDAINRGIAKMSGDLWAWLNSDEQYLPGTLGYVADWFSKHPDADILCGDALLTREDGSALSYRRIIKPLWRHTRLVHLASLSCASFYRRSIVERGGLFDTSWRSIGDAEWMARMMKAGVTVKACRRLLSSYAFTGQNTSESPLAGEEAERWREAVDAPPSWQIHPLIWMHRLRKLTAGAYRRRSVTYALHSPGMPGRLLRSETTVGWGWPVSERSHVAEMRNQEAGLEAALIRPILGSRLLVTDYAGLSRALIREVEAEQGVVAVDFANTQIVTMRRHDRKFQTLTECIDLSVPDGMPLVWCMNRMGAGMKDRVYGPTFTREFLSSCPAEMTHYLVGGSEECGRRFRERMLALNPSLRFVGGYHGPCSADGVLKDDAAVLRDIGEKRPDFIWVGLGTPKQYAWIHRIKPQLDHGVLLAVGFAFDVNAGMKPDAPLWMQRMGLTWVHRIRSEPRRLAGRYLKWNSLFILYSVLEQLNPAWRSSRLWVRNSAMRIVNLFASEIRDYMTGQSLGRGLILGWKGYPKVLGHAGLPPLIPRFLPQTRLTYWKQSIGFTTHACPDFPRILPAEGTHKDAPRVMNVVLTHRGGVAFQGIIERWEKVCREEDLWIGFGGSRRDFELLDYPRKVFVNDPRIRMGDNQREKQSYTGIFQAFEPVMQREAPDFVYLAEYDHLPLVNDLNQRQVETIRSEKADVMGHWLYRVDGTSNYHMLYHETDPRFLPYWKGLSKREDPGVVLSMFGSGSFWTREAFLAVASRDQEIDCYLEIYLPTLVHHLGLRVRGWSEGQHLLSNLSSPTITLEEGRRRGCWTVHPVK